MEYIRTAADKLAIEEGCYWDQAAGDQVIDWARQWVLPQTIKDFHLLPWQEAFIRQLYSWRRPDGSRRFKRAFLSTAKKNGKTLLTSILCLYELLGADVQSPLVVTASTTKENASQIFNEVRYTIDRHEQFAEICKPVPSWKLIRVKSINGELRSLSSDAKNAEGVNASLCVIDEGAWHQSDKLYRSLEYSTIARQGLTVVISTVGTDQSTFFFDLYQKAKAILQGEDTDTSFYAEVWETPSEADLDSPASWALSNPSLGVSFTEADFRRDMLAAKKNVADWRNFQCRRLNMWSQDRNSWLPLEAWDRCKRVMTEAELKDKPCWIGCDLSQTLDLSAVCVVWHLGDKRYYVRPYAFVCEEGCKRREASNLPKYQQFALEGALEITAGNCADYPKIKRLIIDLSKKYKVSEVIFDQFNAIEMAAELLSQGINTFKFPQTVRYYTHPCKEWERAILDGRLYHDGNRLMRWQIQNVTLDLDGNGNCKPSRDRSVDKIDNVVASVMAFSRALESSAEIAKPRSIYESRGITAI